MTQKVCPYCSESILMAAVKCRYCHAILVPEREPAHETGRVTYILDKDLVRFAKFSSAVLLVFGVVGLFLFGFDVKRMHEEVRGALDKVKEAKTAAESASVEVLGHAQESREQARAILAQVGQVELELHAAQVTARALETELQRARAELERVSLLRREYQRSLATPRTTLAEQERLEQLRADTPEIFERGKLWPVGSSLQVGFLGGSPEDHRVVEDAMREWEAVANIRFEIVPEGLAKIRIGFQLYEGSWSFVGTDALGVGPGERTMNFGWDLTLEVGPGTVRHELGHVLGLMHEHLNPEATFEWDQEAVYGHFSAPPNMWSRHSVDRNIFTSWADHELPIKKPYDEDSIMHYKFDGVLFIDGKTRGGATELSETDKRFITQLYPPD